MGAAGEREDGGVERPAPEEGHAPGRVEPHAYWPSILHMGDCAVCGNVQESELHVRPQRVRKDLFDM
jgi:hypothetical protein